MTHLKSTALFLGLTAIALPACDDNQDCDKFAKHVADVLIAEKGEPVEDELKEKMIRKTAESCATEPPSKEVLTCALAAKSSESIKACEKSTAKG